MKAIVLVVAGAILLNSVPALAEIDAVRCRHEIIGISKQGVPRYSGSCERWPVEEGGTARANQVQRPALDRLSDDQKAKLE